MSNAITPLAPCRNATDLDGCQGVVREPGELCRTCQAIEEMVEAILANPGHRFYLRLNDEPTH